MSQDIVSDTLNQIMNAKKSGKKTLLVAKSSKLLKNVLNLAKEKGYLNFTIEGNEVRIEINNINEIKTIKPRYTVSVENLDKYVRRFLPARDFGFLLVSTNKGLMTHQDAKQKNIGGCLIAYVF